MRIVLLLASMVIVLASDDLLLAQDSASPTNEQVFERLTFELAHPSYKRREQAYLRLQRAGEVAKSALERALKSQDMNIRRQSDELLAILRSSELIAQRKWVKSRIDAFMKNNQSLPDWDRYCQIIVERPERRPFFIEMYRTHFMLLDAFERDERDLPKRFEACCDVGEYFSQLKEEESQTFLAPLLLLAGDKQAGLPEATLLKLCRVLQQIDPHSRLFMIFGQANEPSIPYRNIMRHLIDHWLEQPSGMDMPQLACQKMQLMMKLNGERLKKKNLMPLVEVALNPDIAVDRRVEAILGIGAWGNIHDRKLMEMLETLLDRTTIAQEDHGKDTLLIDSALASLVHLSGQRLEIYGFKKSGDLENLFANQSESLPEGPYFDTKEQRGRAIERWRSRIKENPKPASTRTPATGNPRAK